MEQWFPYEDGLLQYGHDLSAVETIGDEVCDTIPVTLQFGHDLSAVETNYGVTVKEDYFVLQFGHDLSAVETCLVVRHGCCIIDALQFGHDLPAVETHAMINIGINPTGASIRPRPFSRGNTHHQAFNAIIYLGRGKLVNSLRMRAITMPGNSIIVNR